MQIACKFVVACSAAAALLLAAGCGAGDGENNSTSAANDGTGGTDTPASTAPGASAQNETDPLHPLVRLETSMGPITVKLDAEKAGMTVDNFLAYVESRHYDNTVFHQVFKNSFVLGGAYTPELVEKQTNGSTIFNQADNGLKNVRGTIAMARQPDSIDSATCQFFFNLSDNPMLDHKGRDTPEYGYCVFGTVTEGLDVLDRIGDVEVTDTEELEKTPVEKVVIQSIRKLP